MSLSYCTVKSLTKKILFFLAQKIVVLNFVELLPTRDLDGIDRQMNEIQLGVRVLPPRTTTTPAAATATTAATNYYSNASGLGQESTAASLARFAFNYYL
jgi:hypothetical protein